MPKFTNLFSVRRVLLLLFLFQLFTVTSQDWSFAKKIGGRNSSPLVDLLFDPYNGIAIDDQGNSYVCGAFKGTANFDGIEVTSTDGNYDIYFVKKNAEGQVQWVKTINSAGYSNNAFAVGVDDYGNSYVSGYVMGNVTFDHLSYSLGGRQRVFLAKYSPQGRLLWVDIAGDPNNNSYGMALTVSNNETVYLTGEFSGTAQFGSHSIIGGRDIFLAMYDACGEVSWVRKISNANQTLEHGVKGIASDSASNVYLTGSYGGTQVFDQNHTMTSRGRSYDVFLAKYSSNGEVQYAVSAGDDSEDYAYGVSLDGKGNAYITGGYRGQMWFNFHLNEDYIITPGGNNIYVAKFDETGKALWAKTSYGSGYSEGKAIHTTKDGTSYVVAQFEQHLHFCRGESDQPCDEIRFDAEYYDQDMLLIKINSEGGFESGEMVGDELEEDPLGLKLDRAGNLILKGFYTDHLTLDPFYLNGYSSQFVSKKGNNPLLQPNERLRFLKSYTHQAGITELNIVRSAEVSHDGKNVYTINRDAIAVYARDENTGDLSYIEIHKDHPHPNGIEGLGGASDAVISPDGRFVYVAAGSDAAIIIFKRDPDNGTLKFVDKVVDNYPNDYGLSGALEMIISPDCKALYVVSKYDGALSVFERNCADGSLFFVQKVVNGGGVYWMNDARSLAMSQDSRHLYIAAQDALMLFDRDISTNRVTFRKVWRNHSTQGNVPGLRQAYAVAVNPNDEYVYVVGRSDDAVVTFRRDRSNGDLEFIDIQKNDVNGVDYMNDPTDVFVSPDGKHVYVSTLSDKSISAFSVSNTTGRLNYVGSEVNGVGGVAGMGAPFEIAVTPDFRHTYIVSPAEHSMAAFELLENVDPTAELSLDFSNSEKEASTSIMARAVADYTVSIPVSLTLRNEGQIAAEEQTLSFFISADEIWDASDSLIKSIPVSPINTNSETIINETLIVDDAPYCSWYLLALADAEDRIIEGNESDNTIVIDYIVQKQPDLVIENQTISAKVMIPGTDITIEGMVENMGNCSADSTYVQAFLSQDDKFSAGDTFLAGMKINPLDPSESGSFSLEGTISTAIPPGQWYVLLVADATSIVNEQNEANNLSTIGIDIKDELLADLEATQTILDKGQTLPGTKLSAEVSYSNSGGLISGTATLGVFISTSPDYGAEAELLIEKTIDPLAPDSETTLDIRDIPLPDIIEPGNYYIIAFLDSKEQIQEYSESNNFSSTALVITPTPKPDLVVSDFSLESDVIVIGSVIPFDFSSQNIGSSESVECEVGYFVSANETYDENDVQVGSSLLSELQPGETTSFDGNLTMAGDFDLGDFWLLAVADVDKQNLELNESNNTFAKAVKIVPVPEPDLIISNVTISPSTLEQGESFLSVFKITNQGSAGAPENILNAYLSSDDIIDQTDLLIASFQIPYLEHGKDSIFEEYIQTTSAIPEGEWNLIWRVDANENVNESIEDNNTFSTVLEIVQPSLPDLTAYQLDIDPKTISIGDTIVASHVLENIGNQVAKVNRGVFYLSKDNKLDPSDLKIGFARHTSLQPGLIMNYETEVAIPKSIEPSNYHLILKVDNSNKIAESNEENNVIMSPIDILDLTPADLEINLFEVENATVKIGTTLTTDIKISNNGGLTSPGTEVKYYLSADNTYSETDKEIALFAIEEIDGSNSLTKQVNVIIPLDVVAGNYYLIAKVDPSDEVEESNEGNNEYAIADIEITENEKPDLYFSSVEVTPYEIKRGTDFTLKLTIANKGEAKSKRCISRVFLSSNGEYNTSDRKLHKFVTPRIKPGENFEYEQVLTIPTDSGTGKCYVITYADYNNKNIESDESLSSNTKATQVKIKRQNGCFSWLFKSKTD